jgi:hypothetical protein
VVSDGSLWDLAFDPANPVWTSRGTPPGVLLSYGNSGHGARGTIQVAPDDRPYIYAFGNDRALWILWRHGDDVWDWFKAGRVPGNTYLNKGLNGALSVDGTKPYAFATPADNSLWLHEWDGARWSWNEQPWKPFNSYGEEAAVVAVNGAADPNLFLIDVASNLWRYSWTAAGGWTWTNQNG